AGRNGENHQGPEIYELKYTHLRLSEPRVNPRWETPNARKVNSVHREGKSQPRILHKDPCLFAQVWSQPMWSSSPFSQGLRRIRKPYSVH
ncbi:unnamed protein product, partial [Caretta caretta]